MWFGGKSYYTPLSPAPSKHLNLDQWSLLFSIKNVVCENYRTNFQLKFNLNETLELHFRFAFAVPFCPLCVNRVHLLIAIELPIIEAWTKLSLCKLNYGNEIFVWKTIVRNLLFAQCKIVSVQLFSLYVFSINKVLRRFHRTFYSHSNHLTSWNLLKPHIWMLLAPKWTKNEMHSIRIEEKWF